MLFDKKPLISVAALLALLIGLSPALADTSVSLSHTQVTANDRLLIDVVSDDAEAFSYTLTRDGEPYLTDDTFVTETRAAYRPQEGGAYVLTVTPKGAPDKAASAAFTVAALPEAQLKVSSRSVFQGEPLSFHAEVTGGALPLSYTYDVLYGQERVDSHTGGQPDFQYYPQRAGVLIVALTVTDSMGHTCATRSENVTVQEDAGLLLSGDPFSVRAQGGVLSWTVHAPGPWKAEASAPFIRLLQGCGGDGDTLTALVDASEGGNREDVIRLTSARQTKEFTVRQSAELEEEGEVFLFSEPEGYLLADGKEIQSLALTAERQELTLPIDASDTWTAEADADFLWAHQSPDGTSLTVTVAENRSDAARGGVIYLRSGALTAAVSVAQEPVSSGADVTEAVLDRDRGLAYQDYVSARIRTSVSARTLTVLAGQNAYTFDDSYAVWTGEDLRWSVSVPLTGSGVQPWLIWATDDQGRSGEKLYLEIAVTGEAEAFSGEEAVVSIDGTNTVLRFRTTAAVQTVALADESGAMLREIARTDCQMDTWIDADNRGRLAEWALSLGADEQLPAALVLGEQTLPVTVRDMRLPTPDETPSFVLYSQQDGSWRDKAYRYSNLEHSGCAIFTLSHALQLLGHTGEDILPERLATVYARCLVDGGTLNSTLIGNAGKEFGFKTRFKLYTNTKDILKKFAKGSVFSFSIAPGHIALTDRVSEDGSMCHIIDSAPAATFSRIKGASAYTLDEASGQFIPLSTPTELSGVRYYIDTMGYDGAEYWLPMTYVSKRGVRLIEP